MKNILILLITIIIFSSCKEPTINKSELPIEVVNLKEVNKYDTTYTITTSEKVFVFNNKKEYVGSYHKNQEIIVFVAIGFFMACTVGIFFKVMSS